MATKTHLYNTSETADITTTGEKLKLDTIDRDQVSAVLYHADSTANYTVQVADAKSATMDDWFNVSTQVQTSSFRFQGTVPERYVRVFENGTDTASGSDTADLSLQATK